jgi:DNA helicase-2/ATP-dependent DNA helicase PcrA
MNDEILINENNQARSFQEKIDSEKERLQKKFSGIEKDTQELLVNIRDQGLSYTDMMDVLRSVQDTYESMDIKYFAEKMTEYQYLKSTPFFARIDLVSNDKSELEKFYLAKFGFFEDGKPILIDWRTKLASLYYKNRFPKAGVSYKVGDQTFTFDMKLKRTFEFDGGKVTKYFNNDIGLSENEVIIDKIKDRSGGVLEDIVETIQESQIEIIDADPRQVCIVQGCVGSGKSTVAIHKLSHIFFNYSELIKPEKSILISKSRVLVDYLSTLFPRLGIFDLKYKTVRDLMFKLLTQDAPKFKFNLDLNQDISDIHLDFYESLDKNIQEIKRSTFEEISKLVNSGMNSETSYYKFNQNLSIKKQISEITTDLDEAVSFLKDDVRELKGNSFEIEKKKLTITRIQNIKKEIKSVESSMLNKSFKEIMKRYSVSGVLGYRESLIFLYTYVELYGIKEEEMFEYCVIDEAQDLCVLELALISKFVTNNRFCIIGDLNQNIHNNPLSTWEEIFPIFKGSKISTFQLDTNYRSTRNIIEFSNKILSSFTKLYLPKSIEKFGPEVELIDSESSEDRLKTFSELIKKDFDDLKKSVGVIFYNFEEYERYISLLQKMSDNPEKLIVLSEDKKAVYSPRVVYATDFSHCKGLEFNKVYLFGFNSHKLNDFEEAKKFFVGSTRAMNELIIFN